MARVIVRPEARQDLRNILVYYIAQSGVDLAKRFRYAANMTFHELAESPLIGSPRKVRDPKFVGVRMWRIRGFESYLVFYFPDADGIAIERVIHASRDYQRILR